MFLIHERNGLRRKQMDDDTSIGQQVSPQLQFSANGLQSMYCSYACPVNSVKFKLKVAQSNFIKH